jgi:serine protease Do
MRITPQLSLALATAALALNLGTSLHASPATPQAPSQPAPSPALTPAATPAPPEVNLRHTLVVDVAKRSKDAVVYISTDKIIAQSVAVFPNNPYIRRTEPRLSTTLGSGFIIHPDGYIVTNNHVIDRAQKIRVETPAGDSYEAEVVGALPEADLAILKVHADHPLPTLPLGDSSDLMIGEPVIAIGNPVNLSYSVSAGIVSAIHRAIQSKDAKSDLEELIQTDAAINPGNSGGPLLNAYGQVIGINTAIRTDAQNIGFAIQVNRLRDLIPTLMNPELSGKIQLPVKLVERRVTTPPSTVTSAVELVTPSGNKPVESINGHKVSTIVDAYAELLNARLNVPLEIVAGGQVVSVTPEPVPVPDAIAQTQKRLGMTVEPNSLEKAQKYHLVVKDGMLVTGTVPRSIAETTGIQPGDVVVFLGTTRTFTLDQYAAAVRQLPTTGVLQIGIVRGGQLLYGTLNL